MGGGCEARAAVLCRASCELVFGVNMGVGAQYSEPSAGASAEDLAGFHVYFWKMKLVFTPPVLLVVGENLPSPRKRLTMRHHVQ